MFGIPTSSQSKQANQIYSSKPAARLTADESAFIILSGRSPYTKSEIVPINVGVHDEVY
jgi:hypothetical protein